MRKFTQWHCTLVAAVFVASLLVATTNASANDVILLQDDFSGTSVNTLNWTAQRVYGAPAGASVTVADGAVTIAQDQTDNGGFLFSRPLTFTSTGLITITDRVYVHANTSAGPFVYGGTSFGVNTNYKQFGVKHVNIVGQVNAFTFGDNTLAADGYGAYGGGNNFGQVGAIWDAWFDEKMTLDPKTSLVTYSVNGGPAISGMLSTPMPQTPLTLSYNSYGWWTGHYEKIDNVCVTQAISMPTANYHQANYTTHFPYEWPANSGMKPTIANIGCVLSSLSDVVAAYGLNYPPDVMLSKLTSVGGITKNDDVAVNAIAFPVAGGYLRASSGVGNLWTIANELEAGRSVMLKVPHPTEDITGNATHTIVALGLTQLPLGNVVDPSTILIADPGSQWHDNWNLKQYFDWVTNTEAKPGTADPNPGYVFDATNWFDNRQYLNAMGSTKSLSSEITKSAVTTFAVSATAKAALVIHSPLDVVITNPTTGKRYVSDPSLAQSGDVVLEKIPLFISDNIDSADPNDNPAPLAQSSLFNTQFPPFELDLPDELSSIGIDVSLVGIGTGSYTVDYMAQGSVVNEMTGDISADDIVQVHFDVPTPEPATLSLLALGGMAILRRRK